MSDIKQCPNCGFKCHHNQLEKTKGLCPRCNPKEAAKYLSRIKNWQGNIVYPEPRGK